MSAALIELQNNSALFSSRFEDLWRDADAHLEERVDAAMSRQRLQRDCAIAELKADLLSEINKQVSAFEQKTTSRDGEVRNILRRVEEGMRGLAAQEDSNATGGKFVLGMMGMGRVSTKDTRHEQFVEQLKRQDERLAKLESEVQSHRSRADLENVMQVADAERRLQKEIERLSDHTDKELRRLERAVSTHTFQGERANQGSSGPLLRPSFANRVNTEPSTAPSGCTSVESTHGPELGAWVEKSV
mmetsp:Transcript_30021/g.80127  ORF Transcript_30021/g.80127 Transcript_30021/m.80127 type:complete len:245 (-) Transcript_30021:56-790(-)